MTVDSAQMPSLLMIVVNSTREDLIHRLVKQFSKDRIMSLVPFQQFVIQNGGVTEVNSTLADVPLSQSTVVKTPEKLPSTGTGSKAHKILQYGSRHTIQNTGWTTRLSCDESTRRNAAPTAKKLPLPPKSAKNQKPVFPHLPFLSISKPTVLKLQSPPTMASTSQRAVQVLGNTASQPVGLQSVLSSMAQCTVTSGSVLQTMLTQPHINISAMTGSSMLNNALLTMPTIATHTSGKPPTVCFIPVSSVICAPVSGFPTDVHMMENMPGTFPVAQGPTSLFGVHKPNLEPLLTSESKTIATDVTTKPASGSLSPKELLTWTPDGQALGVRMLTMKVHIDHGHITEVKELSQKQPEPSLTPGLNTMPLNAAVLTSTMVSGAAVASQTFLDHVDTNGAQFAYHDLTDGTRIRLARDTNGQRHAPFFLIPNDDDSCSFEEYTVELRTRNNTERQVVPHETDVSGVGTVFTYEPLYVSEQTLVPLHGNKRSYDSPVSLSEDESNYYYKCYLCSFVSDDHVKVCRHWVNVHLTELPYRCLYCDRTFFTSTKAQVHAKSEHKGNGLTTVGFHQSNYFVNTLSYEVGETDNEDSDSDKEGEDKIVLEHSNLRLSQRKNSIFVCRKCHFKTRSLVEMHGHVKFVHGQFGHSQLKLIQPSETEQQTSNKQLYGASRLLRAETALSNISEKLTVDGECRYQCRWCAFQGKNASVISLHVLQQHQWPAAVLCPSCSCNILLTDVDRISTSVTCTSCKANILLVPTRDDSDAAEAQDVVFMCNICAFKTRGRNHMFVHIKYNHTKCRPYTCVYCNYVAVERTQVKLHVANHHPDQSVIVKERSEAHGQFRHVINNLFPKLVSVQTSEDAGLPLNVDIDSAESDSSKPAPSTDVDSLFFTCEECKLETSSLAQLIRHQHHYHKSTLATNAAMIPAKLHYKTGTASLTATLNGEHFKCKICGYCCMDRSCMSRHVKYMHITARPHSCMYCSYNNVEKTKVRLHVKAHHPDQQKAVLTDHKVLDEMSRQAKHLYVRIDCKGLCFFLTFNYSTTTSICC